MAIAAARPQERLQLRRMADASLALAERRADDLKVAVERLGQTPRRAGSSSRCGAMFGRRAAGRRRDPAPDPRGPDRRGHPSCSRFPLGWGIVQLIALPFGGIGVGVSFFLVLPAGLHRGRRADLRRPPAPGEGAREGRRAARRAVQALAAAAWPSRMRCAAAGGVAAAVVVEHHVDLVRRARQLPGARADLLELGVRARARPRAARRAARGRARPSPRARAGPGEGSPAAPRGATAAGAAPTSNVKPGGVCSAQRATWRSPGTA